MNENSSPTPTKKISKQYLTFTEAIQKIKDGFKVSKEEWGNPAFYGFLDEGRLRIVLADGKHDWIVSDGDMAGEDWFVIQ